MNNQKSPLNKRQDSILSFFKKNEEGSISEIAFHLATLFPDTSTITINRDLSKLTALNFLTKQGAGRGITYILSPSYAAVAPIDIEGYFQGGVDARTIQERFDMGVFSTLKEAHIFSEEEHTRLGSLAKDYKKHLKLMKPSLLKREFERLVIEFSWKSSKIEGNTYSLLETEQLLTKNEEASGHSVHEARMILNQKSALEYVRKHAVLYKKINVSMIEDIHRLLTKGLDISSGLRKHGVGIVGTRYRPLDNIHQIRDALQLMCTLANVEKDPFAKAVVLMALIAYIQPFEDGNKRTSRLMGNAILMAHDLCPLSYRSVNEVEYKKAIILFYEQNSIRYFADIFVEQFSFAVENYFRP